MLTFERSVADRARFRNPRLCNLAALGVGVVLAGLLLFLMAESGFGALAVYTAACIILAGATSAIAVSHRLLIALGITGGFAVCVTVQGHLLLQRLTGRPDSDLVKDAILVSLGLIFGLVGAALVSVRRKRATPTHANQE
jgi:hypothetical protein